MRLSWASEAPTGVSFQSEEEVLTRLEHLAESAGFSIVSPSNLDYDARSLADMVIRTQLGLLLFGVRQKSHNGAAKIDIETRPSSSYRTRHLLLQQRNGHWELRNDSNLSEGEAPSSKQELEQLVTKLFSSQ